MGYRYLDMDTYKRKSHFEYFNSLAYPYVGLTVNVDITEPLKRIRSEKWSFFFTVCYCVSKAANEVSEFRQRIINNKIAEFDHCKTSHTVALENGTYCYCTLDSNMPFAEYLPYASREQESAKQKKSIEENSYTALIQPVPIPADSNPRITWGKYFIQEGSVLMPVSVLCHHGLVDGIHIAEFYKQLDEQMRQLT